MKKFFTDLLLLFPIPIVTFFLYGVLRILSYRPPIESGMSEFMTSFFFVAGATVCYFVMAAFGVHRKMNHYWKWFVASCLLFLLSLDETFMIHEQLSDLLGTSDNYIFAVYGLIFLVTLFLFRKSCRGFWIFTALFIIFCTISQTADTFQGEGMINIAGRDIDYEQIFEWFGAMWLAYAFSFEAYQTLGLPGLGNRYFGDS